MGMGQGQYAHTLGLTYGVRLGNRSSADDLHLYPWVFWTQNSDLDLYRSDQKNTCDLRVFDSQLTDIHGWICNIHRYPLRAVIHRSCHTNRVCVDSLSAEIRYYMSQHRVLVITSLKAVHKLLQSILTTVIEVLILHSIILL